MDLINWLTVLCGLAIVVWLYLRKKYSFWTSRKVPGPRPVPFMGHILQYSFGVTHILDVEYAKKYGPIYGIYEGVNPVLQVSDPEVARHILVKDFSHFVNRQFYEGFFGDPVFDHILDLLEDDKWKRVRAAITPAFTSGKLKRMVPLIDECVNRMMVSMKKEMVSSGSNAFDSKDLFSKMAMNVIALCGFGLDFDPYTGEQHPFVKHANNMFKSGTLQIIVFYLGSWAMKVTNMALANPEASLFFASVVEHAIKERRSQMESGKKYSDFIQIMIEGKEKGDEMIMTDIELVAQCVEFILAGYETTTITLQFLTYCLAMHPHEQDLLVQELTTVLGDPQEEQLDVSQLYDSLPKLVRLQAFIDETLRLYTPASRSNVRRAKTDYTLPPCSLGDNITIPKGTLVRVPCSPFHLDEKYFADPLQFKSDRFMPENSAAITPFTFLPFGAGPRMCPGFRFSTVNIKIALIKLLRAYRVVKVKETPDRITYVTGQEFVHYPNEKIIVGYDARLDCAI